MTYFHRMILRMLPGPFLGWLGMLTFLLLMQFLIRWLPQLVGKELPLTVIIELIAYNLAYMIVLAVPMSVLIASLMTFGRIAETKAFAVMKGAGVSVVQILWPPLVLAGLLTAGMLHFNNEVLPEANYRARNLWLDIRAKKPGFELQPGVFYEGVSNYSILVQGVTPEGELRDVTIFDYTDGSRNRVDIKAERGRIVSLQGGAKLDLILEHGQVDRPRWAPSREEDDRYERLSFDRHRLRLDLSDFVFERSDPSDRSTRRTDRTMRTAQMVAYVDSLEERIAEDEAHIHALTLGLLRAPLVEKDDPGDDAPGLPVPPDAVTYPGHSPRAPVVDLNGSQQQRVYDTALTKVRSVRAQVEQTKKNRQYRLDQADRYRVEIHKKYSIAVACFVFMLIGIPIGLSIRRGGLGVAGGLAIGIFLFFWVTLVQGEKLADRDKIEPWIGMWVANILTGGVGLWLVAYVLFDVRGTVTLRRRLLQWFRRSQDDVALADAEVG